MPHLSLTPEANAEVRRNLLLSFGLTACGLLLLVLLLAIAINPPGGTQGFQIGSLLLVAFILPGIAMTASCLILAYPMGCWPGFMRARKLADLYGIHAAEMSNRAMRRRMLQPRYWRAFATGAVVAAAFVGPWFFGWWATHPGRFPEGFAFPALSMCLFSGGLSARAWVARDLIARRVAKDRESLAATG